jgi:hypothetical protein
MLRLSICGAVVAVLLQGCGDSEPARIDLLESEARGDAEPACTRAMACAAPTPYCYIDDCVECLTDDNCGNDNCDPVAHVCVKCVTSGDCMNDRPYCHESECVECLESANCGDDSLTCDLRDNRCKPRCVSDDGCSGSKTICSPSSELCVQCLVNSDCAADKPYCNQLECVMCRDDSDCDEVAPLCDPDKLECVGCLSDGDCEGDAVCDKRACKP